jgi:hypothetical protein
MSNNMPRKVVANAMIVALVVWDLNDLGSSVGLVALNLVMMTAGVVCIALVLRRVGAGADHFSNAQIPGAEFAAVCHGRLRVFCLLIP